MSDGRERNGNQDGRQVGNSDVTGDASFMRLHHVKRLHHATISIVRDERDDEDCLKTCGDIQRTPEYAELKACINSKKTGETPINIWLKMMLYRL